MGSRMKFIMILLFVGLSGFLFLFQHNAKEAKTSKNFLSENEETSSVILTTEEDVQVEEPDQAFKEEREEEELIVIHICGAVNREGVYTLKKGSRVIDAIQMAGGLKKEADKNRMNQASPLSDGMQIYIPKKNEEKVKLSILEEKDDKININTASKEELMELPGVGASRAEAILQFRKEQGGFKKIEEIMKIHGIKEHSFEKIKNKIKI